MAKSREARLWAMAMTITSKLKNAMPEDRAKIVDWEQLDEDWFDWLSENIDTLKPEEEAENG